MSDESSERLAPVTYLPWAKEPVAPPARASRVQQASVDARDSPREENVPLVRPAQDVPRESPRREQTSATRGRGAVGHGRAREVQIGADEPDETGAERDARVDRLVVSRLRRSALSVSEVRAVLVEHGLDDIEVEEWVERYERLGYLDDAKLAEQVVHSHGVRRGRGSGAILQELGRRGVDTSLARAAVEDLDPETELDNARVVAERRARQLRGLDRQTAERRLSAFLQRRGYPGDVVREAVSAALAADRS